MKLEILVVALGAAVGAGALSACGNSGQGGAAGASTQAAPAAAPVAKAEAGQLDHARFLNADSEPGSWLATGRDYKEQRFSPLEKINADNVSKLGLAWSYKVDVDRATEATPVVIDGVMYTTGAYSIVYALDAKTGALIWKYDPEVPRNKSGNACCDVANRGVAVRNGLVYLGTFDGRLVAIHAADGTKAWEINTIDDPKRSYSITSEPRIVKNMVILGNGGGEFNARGYISAFNAEDGKLLWRFYTTPGDPKHPQATPALEMAKKTWDSDKYWEQGGGGTVWNSFLYDPDTNLVIFGTGNGVSWNKIERGEPKADNLFLSSLVAVNADTGEYKWHYQEVPGDNWDYDACANIIFADLTLDGKPRKVLLHAPKDAFFYVLDRATGELLSAEKFAPSNWATHVDLKTGRPAIDQAAMDWTKGPKVISPGPFGAHNWQPMSFSPKTGLAYIPAQQAPSVLAPRKDPTFDNREAVWNIGAELPLGESAKDVDAAASAYKGMLVAWDPVAQKQVWSVDHANIWNGGTLATAGNLVFQGTADGRVVAYSADKGAKLWESPANTGVMAGPMSYEIDGEQYVTVMAGWGGAFALVGGAVAAKAKVQSEARVLTYKLGGTATLPPRKDDPVPLPEIPELKADAKTVALGGEKFAQNCAWCHGLNAAAGGVIPDVRYLTPEKHQMFAAIVAGAKADRGMPSFAAKLKPEEVDAIHQYIIKRQQDLKAELAGSTVSSTTK